MKRFSFAAGLGLLILLSAAACSNNTTPDTSIPGPSASAAIQTPPSSPVPSQVPGSPTASASPTSALPDFQPATTDITGAGTAKTGQPILADVRIGRNDGYDRVVFEFQGPDLPSYDVKYVQSAAQCGSGKQVTTAGAALLSVTLRPATAHDQGGNSTISSTDIVANLQSVKEAKSTCDFEGVVGWVIGTAFRPFRVFELQSPTRLVIDVQQ